MSAATLMLGYTREEDLVSGALVPLTIVEARLSVSSETTGACHPEAV